MKHIRDPLLLLLLVSIPTLILYRYSRPNPSVVQSELGIITPYSQPTDDQVTKTALPVVWTLMADSISSRDIQVRFLYRCSPQCGSLWLTVTDEADTEVKPPLEMLISHPLLEETAIPYISNAFVRLYQRSFTYHTLEDFYSNPPIGTVIVADDEIMRMMSPLYNVTALRNYTSTTFPDYLLTTYEKPRIFGEYSEFTRILSRNSLPLSFDGNLKLTVSSEGEQGNKTLIYTMPTFNQL